MNAQDSIKQQRRRRRKTAVLAGAVMLFMLAVVVVVAWVLGEPTNADIPEPGVNTTPPDQYPEVEAHAVTMAGYDFSDEDRPIILLSDPADNSIAGKTHDFEPTPTRLPLVTDGRWWFVDYPGEAIGCIYAALIVREAGQDNEEAPNQWDLPGLPDLSQNAVEAWGESYCAPTAAANIVWMLGEDYPPLAPASVFGLMQDATPDERANRLVGGVAPPIPALGSLANLMGTEKISGTVLQDAASGLGAYLRENDTAHWAVNDSELIPHKSFMEKLKNESARGSGIVLLLHWGNLKMDGDEDGRSILVALERNAPELEHDKLMQALLMPGRDKAWKRFVEDQSLQASPAKLMPREARLLVNLLRDKNLKGLKLGQIREIEYVDLRPVEKPWSPVFVYGGIGRRSDRTAKQIEWAHLYDPAKFPDELKPEYRSFRPSHSRFKFVYEKGSEIAVSPPEIRLLNRTGISELITGRGDTIAGQYLAASGEKGGRLTIQDDGRCSLLGDDFPGGHGTWHRLEGVSVQFTLFDPAQNQTTWYTMDWMGNALLAHAVHGRSDFMVRFGGMSREMLTFTRKGTQGGYVTASVGMARVMDMIIADTEASPLFKIFFLDTLKEITAVRPGEWDTDWLEEPSVETAIKKMETSGLIGKSGIWMVPEIQKKLSPPSEELLTQYSKFSLEESVRLAHQIVRKPYDAGFTLVGFVELDHGGDELLRLRKATTKRLWGWDSDGKPGRLFEWDPEKKRHKATDAMPFSPVYEFNGDAAAIKAALLKGNKTGYSDEVIGGWFPPLYR